MFGEEATKKEYFRPSELASDGRRFGFLIRGSAHEFEPSPGKRSCNVQSFEEQRESEAPAELAPQWFGGASPSRLMNSSVEVDVKMFAGEGVRA